MRGIASKGQLRMSFLRIALFTVPAIVLLGIVSGRASNSGYSNGWFAALDKPAMMPEGWVFGAAWTILYILLGLVLAMILHAQGARRRGLVIGLFLAQLLLNYAWSPVFFGLHQPEIALVIILLMLALAGAAAVLMWWIRKAATLLMLPYLAWLCFATALTVQIIQLNPNASELAPSRGSADIAL